MSTHDPARPTGRRPRAHLAACVAVGAALIFVVLGYQSSTAISSSADAPFDVTGGAGPATAGAGPETAGEVPSRSSPTASATDVRRSQMPSTTAPPIDVPPVELGSAGHESHAAIGESDGVLPDGTTVFDGELPGVSRLEPALLEALRQAASDAAVEGVHFVVSSGWRSPEYQRQLLREAVSTYGSAEEAARWVATTDTSAHVSGDAVDLGPTAATVWLSEHGADYGLCQIYRNEPWHFELRSDADHGCPPSYADPTQDPKMQP